MREAYAPVWKKLTARSSASTLAAMTSAVLATWSAAAVIISMAPSL
jgi:hypothetical protein